jgi:hypothetical protein
LSGVCRFELRARDVLLLLLERFEPEDARDVERRREGEVFVGMTP